MLEEREEMMERAIVNDSNLLKGGSTEKFRLQRFPDGVRHPVTDHCGPSG
jgi:hypothetical protein